MATAHSKASILIPVYNSERYLKRCLQSVVSQTYKNLQVVIINDGSTDGSLKICEDFADKYPFVEVFNQENSGVAATRNRLLSKISGDYFLFVDSDDWIEPDMVETLVKVLESYNVDISVCGNVVERDNLESDVIKNSEPAQIYNQKEAVELFLYHQKLNGSLWNKLIKREIAFDIEFDSSVSYGEDALFIWGCLKNVRSIAITKAQLYHYQVNYESISHQRFGHKKLSGHKVWEKIAEDTASDWAEFKEIAKANYAVSDFWLLVFAARDNYPQDVNIRLFRKNLKSQIESIRRLNLLYGKKLIVAQGFILNYYFTGVLLRLIRPFLNF